MCSSDLAPAKAQLRVVASSGKKGTNKAIQGGAPSTATGTSKLMKSGNWVDAQGRKGTVRCCLGLSPGRASAVEFRPPRWRAGRGVERCTEPAALPVVWSGRGGAGGTPRQELDRSPSP